MSDTAYTLPAPCAFRQSLDCIFLACTGWFFFCLCDAIVKFLASDYNVIQIMAISSLAGTIMTGTWILFTHGWRGFMPPCLKWYLVRMVNVVGSGYFINQSLSLISMADFYGIIFLTPMMTTMVAAIFLKEQVGIWRWSAIAMGFVGVLFVIGSSFQENMIGYLYAFIGVLFSSSNALVFQRIGCEQVMARYAFYPFIATALFFLPLMAIGDHFKTPAQPVDWLLLVSIAPISLIGMIGYSSGFARARDTSLIAPFHYSQMIWGIILGYLIFHDTPGPATLIGSLIIVASGLMVIWREHVNHTKIATELEPRR